MHEWKIFDKHVFIDLCIYFYIYYLYSNSKKVETNISSYFTETRVL